MNITETISLLDELRKKATQGEYANRDNRALLVLNDNLSGNCKQIAVEMHKDDIQYIATLHNNYEALRQAALDGERYRKAGEDRMKENMVQQLTGWSHAAQGYSVGELISSAGLKESEWESIKKEYYVDFLTEKDIKEIEDTLASDRQAVEQKDKESSL